ncbi:hypothetical protein H2201_002904 [Coniosporium apollinis]|uniref:Zinc/iron permease n=1 Tax=Coniosporium apollinis TaxID=61459 RepID=A0ABQ9P0L0_9PEZI|nr:hypothetical protein H2201_002904 [Coniosporium apollinis]
MWSGLFMLLTLSMIMAIASFLAGMLPLSLALSQRQLRFTSALGTGVLVGTSLIVIIPEGIETLYSAGTTGHTHTKRNRVLLEASTHRVAPIDDSRTLELNNISPSHAHTLTSREAASPLDKSDNAHPAEKSHDHKADDHNAPKPTPPSPHAYVGLSLITGFILMHLISTLPTLLSARTTPKPLHISLDRLSRGPHDASSPPLSSPSTFDAPSPDPPSDTAHPPATTIGLVIHAAADGIALGASTSTSTSESTKLGLVVFVALMIHKAPAAFGLTSVLLKQGFSKRTARMHLVVFSLAAPVGALVTWVVVNLVGGEEMVGKGEGGMGFVTGCVLLFSGGTFLYVAMHAMQESLGGHSHGGGVGSEQADGYRHVYGGSNGYVEAASYEQQGHRGVTLSETAVAVAGMLLPLLTQVGHAH